MDVPIRIYCDFLKETAGGLRRLDTAGARADIARLSGPLAVGTSVILYDADADDDGTTTWLVVDATIEALPDATLAARIVGQFRHEPR